MKRGMHKQAHGTDNENNGASLKAYRNHCQVLRLSLETILLLHKLQIFSFS